MKKLHLVVKTTSLSGTFKESDSKFECEGNNVIVGRCHKKDENGDTVYKYGELEFENTDNADKYVIALTDPTWSDEKRESNSSFECPVGQVIVGRQHDGDENGYTKYKTCKVQILIKADADISFGDRHTIESKESDGEWVERVDTDKTYEVMVGRDHDGDENGKTSTMFTRLAAELKGQ